MLRRRCWSEPSSYALTAGQANHRVSTARTRPACCRAGVIRNTWANSSQASSGRLTSTRRRSRHSRHYPLAAPGAASGVVIVGGGGAIHPGLCEGELAVAPVRGVAVQHPSHFLS